MFNKYSFMFLGNDIAYGQKSVAEDAIKVRYPRNINTIPVEVRNESANVHQAEEHQQSMLYSTARQNENEIGRVPTKRIFKKEIMRQSELIKTFEKYIIPSPSDCVA